MWSQGQDDIESLALKPSRTKILASSPSRGPKFMAEAKAKQRLKFFASRSDWPQSLTFLTYNKFLLSNCQNM